MGGSPKGGSGQQGQFSFGPSQFDLQAILHALAGNEQAITNRYTQLGVGNVRGGGESTMLQQDLAQAGLQAQAAIGQEQTSSVQSPATNPALQPPSTSGTTALTTLGGLASDVSKIAGPLNTGAAQDVNTTT